MTAPPCTALPRGEILVGDAATRLSELPSASVDMVLTSPPYFRLRDYAAPGQLGLEPHVDGWVADLRTVAREIERVLVPTGSFWVNVGDTYSTHHRQGAARKSLLLGPERLALRLIEDGWRLRNKVVWQKANSLPHSVQDRLTCTWEGVYVFVRSDRYFFDLDAIRVPHRTHPPAPRPWTPTSPHRERWRGPNADDTSGLARMKAAGRIGHPLGKNPGDVWRLPASNYRGSHHATFPIALAELAVRAGCPERRCTRCHSPHRRPLHRTDTDGRVTARRGDLAATCGCLASSEPGLVLDPFIGAGTTALGAIEHCRDWLGIELNPDFAAEARERIGRYRPTWMRQPPHATGHDP